MEKVGLNIDLIYLVALPLILLKIRASTATNPQPINLYQRKPIADKLYNRITTISEMIAAINTPVPFVDFKKKAVRNIPSRVP